MFLSLPALRQEQVPRSRSLRGNNVRRRRLPRGRLQGKEQERRHGRNGTTTVVVHHNFLAATREQPIELIVWFLVLVLLVLVLPLLLLLLLLLITFEFCSPSKQKCLT